MFVVVDWDDRRPAYLQLRDQIVEQIARAELTAGMALPSVRRLASELGVNLHTVHKAFELLRDQGFIQVRAGSSAMVRPAPGTDTATALAQALGPRLAEAWVKGLARSDIIGAVEAILDTFEPTADPVTAPARRVGQGGR